MKLLILEAADAHLVHFLGQAVVHFKDLEIRGALCDLHAVEGGINVAAILGIPVVAWLAGDEITVLHIANDYGRELSVFHLCKVADAALELFFMIMD